MATEYEELRLNVSLVDNVSSALERIKSSLQNLGGGPSGAGMDRLKRQSQELTGTIKGLTGGFGEAATAIGKFAGPVGLAAGAVVGLGVAVAKALSGLRDYANEMDRLGKMATQTGLSAGQIKSMSEAMERSGISADKATANLSGLAGAMADIGRANSELRQKLLAGAGQGSDRAQMEMLLGELGRVANNPEAFANRVRQAMDEIYDAVLARTGSSTRAAEARDKFSREFGAPDLKHFRGEFQAMTREQAVALEASIRDANEFNAVTARIGQSWGKITDTISSVVLPAATAVLKPLANELADIASAFESIGNALKNLSPPQWFAKIGEVAKGQIAGSGIIAGIGAGVGAGVGAVGAGVSALGTGAANVGAGVTGAASAAAGGVRGLLPAWAGGVAKKQFGGVISHDMLAMLHEGEEVIPAGQREGGGGGGRLILEQNRQMHELNATTEEQAEQSRQVADELRTLNQYLMSSMAGAGGAAAGGGIRMAGLGGLPGMRGGGGGAYGGGGGYAGAGVGATPRISGTAGGGATPAAWGDSAYGGGATPTTTGMDAGGGASPSATAGPAGDPTVPGALLEQARTVAITSGPGGVDAFMKAQGYPRSGAWCGSFAASVVKSQGLTPPRNPEVASNWRNFGEAVTGQPQAGDVAIRRGARTGGTGSHVTFVQDIDPSTGRFTGFGGNQGGAARASRYATSQFDFRRAPGGGVKPEGSDVGAGGGSSGGGGATASWGGGGKGGDLFNQRAPQLMTELQEDLGLSKHQAAGLVGNLGYESAGFKSLQEGKPIAGAGGFGYAQWTGPRRNEFFKWARDNQLDPKSHEANAGFLKHELRGKHSGFLERLKKTQTLQEATRLTHEKYETPADVQPKYWAQGVKPYKSAAGRLQYAQQAAGLDRGPLDRDMGTEVNHKVEGTGKLTVDVNAPAGTKVQAEGGGLFKNVETNRQVQMAEASEGPAA
jgi:uncharacterized protein (TIGR02594 family)